MIPVPTLALYAFRFRDPLTGKWVRARHKMQVPELQRHYSDWKITGAPEIRHVTETSVQSFSPFAPPARAIIAPMLLWTRAASRSDACEQGHCQADCRPSAGRRRADKSSAVGEGSFNPRAVPVRGTP